MLDKLFLMMMVVVVVVVVVMVVARPLMSLRRAVDAYAARETVH